jgi:hypothetical protein
MGVARFAQCAMVAACTMALSGCGSDPRTDLGKGGVIPFAPVKTAINAAPSRGAPSIAPFLPKPARGLVYAETNFGASTSYAFNAATGLLTGVWIDADMSGSGGAAPVGQKHAFKLPDAEQTALIRMINLAWGARHEAGDAAGTQAGSPTIWLIDGAAYKAIDGRGAGEVIRASLISLAHTHGVVRDDHEH